MCDRLLVVQQKQMIRRTKDNRLFWTDIYLHDCPGMMPPRDPATSAELEEAEFVAGLYPGSD